MSIISNVEPSRQLVHHSVRPVTREVFPLYVPVIVEAMIDREPGWEFDAPLHFIAPFHRYCEVGSICETSVLKELDDLLLDLDCCFSYSADAHCWPYLPAEYLRFASRVRAGHDRRRFAYFRCEVTVTRWGTSDASDCGEWNISVVR